MHHFLRQKKGGRCENLLARREEQSEARARLLPKHAIRFEHRVAELAEDGREAAP